MRNRLRHASARIHLTPKQANIYAWGWQPDARFRYAVCGRRFGKTFLGCEEIRRAVRLAIERNVSPDNEIWYGAPTFKQAKRVMWARLKRNIPESWIDTRVNNTECIIPLKSGHVIRLVGLDDPDSLRGSGLWFFIGDEWDDAKPVVWTEAIRPMLSTAAGHALFIGTPKGFGQLYEGYKDGQPGALDDEGKPIPDTRSWKYNTLEGGNVPQDEVDAARRTLDARTFRQEYEASFETYSGRVYYEFDRAECVKSDIELRSDMPIHVGMDFNINPMTASIWQEHIVVNQVISHQVDEIVIPTSNTHEMGREIAERFGRKGFNPDQPELKHITIYPDPAGASRSTSAQGETDLSILRKMGFPVYAMSSHPLIRDRINLVNSRIKTSDGKRHMFWAPKCRHSIEAMEKHTYREGTSEPEKGEWDHINDTTGYYVYTRFAHQKAHGRKLVPHMAR